jgi:hypothetical protein
MRLAALGVACGLPASAGLAQTLAVQPTSISVASADSVAEARVVFENSGAKSLRNISLTQLNSDGIVVELGSPGATVCASKCQIVWRAKMTMPANVHLPGTVVFDASYTTAKVLHHVYVAFAVKSDAPPKLVEVALDGTPDPVSEQRPSAVNLMVTNYLDVPVTVSVPRPSLSAGLVIPDIKSFPVLAHSTAAQRVDLKTEGRVTPGVQPVAIDVDVTWTRDGQADERHFVLTKPVTVGIFFESDLLKVLSIPSFLVLPGCLVIFTMQLMLNLGIMGLKNQSNLPALSVTSPEFWIPSITLSWIFVWIYYEVTGVDCLLSYGADDMRNIWVSSILLGVLLFLGIGLVNREWRREFVPTSMDTPLETLSKMGRHGLKVERPTVMFKMDNVEVTAFAIENIREDQTIVWVAAHIAIDWQSSTEVQELKRQFDEIINGSRDAGALVKILCAAGDRVTLAFETNGSVPNPYHLKLDAIARYADNQLIVG